MTDDAHATSLAHTSAERVRARLSELGAKADREVQGPGDRVSFVFEAPGVYADVECMDDGSILAGLVVWGEAASEVLEVDATDRATFRPTWERIATFLRRPTGA